MLSEIVKKRIEEKSGISIRYSRDCEALANKIVSESNCRLSPSTIRRLFGFIKGTKEVRIHTLDVISNYLGHTTWDELIQTLNQEESTKPKVITELNLSKLKPGDQYGYTYKPDAEIIFKCLGKSKFSVIDAINGQLKKNDIFTANMIALHYPFFISELERNGNVLGKVIEGKISGITSIKKL
jgi:hypothetical protein